MELSSSGPNHFDVYVKNYSYDQDNVSKPYRGISQVQVRYREVGSTYWTIKPAMNVNAGERYYVDRLPSGKNYEIAVRARDIDGRNNLAYGANGLRNVYNSQPCVDLSSSRPIINIGRYLIIYPTQMSGQRHTGSSVI